MRSLFTPPRGRGDRGVGAALAPSPRVVVSARAVVVCVLASMPLLLRWYARSLETFAEETTSLAVGVAGEFAGGSRATADWSSYDRAHEDDAAAARTTASREEEEREAAERARRAELSARAERWFHGAERLADVAVAASSSSSSSMGGADASLESAPDDADADAAPPDVNVVVATTTADAPDSVLRWAAYHAGETATRLLPIRSRSRVARRFLRTSPSLLFALRLAFSARPVRRSTDRCNLLLPPFADRRARRGRFFFVPRGRRRDALECEGPTRNVRAEGVINIDMDAVEGAERDARCVEGVEREMARELFRQAMQQRAFRATGTTRTSGLRTLFFTRILLYVARLRRHACLGFNDRPRRTLFIRLTRPPFESMDAF